MKLTNFKVLTFDVYGTLIDWESGMIEGLKPLTEKVEFQLDRDQILEAHARHESSNQHYTPAKRYQDLLAVVYRRLAEEWGVYVTRDDCLAYGRSVENWPVFSDSVKALYYLKNYYKLVVLSNIDNDSFVFINNKLGVKFDAIYTAEDIGSYKPSPRNFEYMIENLSGLGVQKTEILHTAESMFHDHNPANDFDLANSWIYRRHEQKGFGATMNPGTTPTFYLSYNSMADFVAAHKAEIN